VGSTLAPTVEKKGHPHALASALSNNAAPNTRAGSTANGARQGGVMA